MSTQGDAIFELHAIWEADNPDEREYAEGLEQNRRSRHVLAHGSDDGYRPGRTFPCSGALRYLIAGERHRVVVCDVCQFEISLPVTGPVAGSTQEEW